MLRLLGWIVALGVWAVAASGARAEVRVALVVGNGAYKHTAPLANPINDARDMSAALKARGFSVVEAYDADKRGLDVALRTFSERLAKADVALFFYAGHGLQVGLQNYLVPVDARLERERDLEFEAVKLELVLRQMELDREGKTSIVILDACRDNPLARNLAQSMGTRSTAIGRGLASAPAGLGTFIAYSTQPGNVALDGTGRNSPFAAALLKHMPVQGRNLPALLIEVRKDVVAATRGQQVPWDHSALTRDFYFAGAGSAPRAPAQTPDAAVAVAPAAPEPAPPALQSGGIPPIQTKADIAAATAAKATRFEINDNVRLEGRVISSSRQPNPAACRAACAANTLCLGFQHGRRIPVMGQCEIFDRVDARLEDLRWHSGVRQP